MPSKDASMHRKPVLFHGQQHVKKIDAHILKEERDLHLLEILSNVEFNCHQIIARQTFDHCHPD